MTTVETNHDSMQEDTDDTADLTHELGGVAIDGAAMNTTTVADGARVVVDRLDANGGPVVTLSIRADDLSGRVILNEDTAAEVADQLADAAEDADE